MDTIKAHAFVNFAKQRHPLVMIEFLEQTISEGTKSSDTMIQHIAVSAPYGLKKDGTPKKRMGRPRLKTR